ncbi:MAG: response regulator [Verrucomicrobia bacterium]|nr:response regulator [Verrucomicrobiota bacterium]
MDLNFPILIAEDDPNDALFLQRAMQRAGVNNPIRIVEDGEEAIAYLEGREPYSDRQKYPFPSFVWLDIKMPKKNGFDVLGWMRGHPKCSIIPCIVWSSSREERDVRVAYRLGANCFFRKPTRTEDLEKVVKQIFEFWATAERPDVPNC